MFFFKNKQMTRVMSLCDSVVKRKRSQNYKIWLVNIRYGNPVVKKINGDWMTLKEE